MFLFAAYSACGFAGIYSSVAAWRSRAGDVDGVVFAFSVPDPVTPQDLVYPIFSEVGHVVAIATSRDEALTIAARLQQFRLADVSDDPGLDIDCWSTRVDEPTSVLEAQRASTSATDRAPQLEQLEATMRQKVVEMIAREAPIAELAELIEFVPREVVVAP